MHDLRKYVSDEDRELDRLAEDYEAAIVVRDYGNDRAESLTAKMVTSTSPAERERLAGDLGVVTAMRDQGQAWMERLEAEAGEIDVTPLETILWMEDRAEEIVELGTMFDGPAFGESS